MIKQVLTDSTTLDAETEKLQIEIVAVTELIRQCVDDNARIGLDQAEYQKRYEGFVARYERAKGNLKKVDEQRQARRVKREQIEIFLETMSQKDSVLSEFDESLWFALIDKVTVYAADDIQFTFRDGMVIKA